MESYIGPPALSLSKGAAIHDVARSNWYYIGELLTKGSWWAENQGDGTWLVTATDQDGNYYTFEADSIHNIICYVQSPVCQ
jgi:hypothetical protein